MGLIFENETPKVEVIPEITIPSRVNMSSSSDYYKTKSYIDWAKTQYPLMSVPDNDLTVTSFETTTHLSTLYTFGDLTDNEEIYTVGDLTKEKIAYHLKCLAINILEPIHLSWIDFLQPTVVSAYRNQANSDELGPHHMGFAVDIVFNFVRGKPFEREFTFLAAQEIKNKIPFDQMILEYTTPSNTWLHLSWNPYGNTPNTAPEKILTYWNHNFYSTGLSLLKYGD
jgi:hypothetical protein